MLSGIFGLTLFLLQANAVPARNEPDCFAQAGQQYGVDPDVLIAIAWRESHFTAWKSHRNTDGTIDYGLMQINSRNLSALHLTPQSALAPCASILGAARLYSGEVRRYGNTWNAVGAYHSTTPALQQRYARDIWATYTVIRAARQAVVALRTLADNADVVVLGEPIASPWTADAPPATSRNQTPLSEYDPP